MLGDRNDVEYLIEALDKISDAKDAIAGLGMQSPPESIYTVRSEVEWFVQHAAEKISAVDAHLMWGATLRAISDHNATFVTTNYDRAIELAANAEGIRLNDGYESFTDLEVAAWIDFDNGGDCPILAKLHGSTDWYSDTSTGEPRKLRHPMPLFGHGRLRLANNIELGSAMVLPSREKLLNRSPYPRMSHAFLTAVDECEFAIFIGSSFRDVNVRDEAAKIARNRPVFVVNRTGYAYDISDARPVAQPASQFLISTLPAALASSDPVRELEKSAKTEHDSVNVLQLLKVATDVTEHAERRCHAIEELDMRSLPLDETIVSRLVSDENSTVSKFSLGLVATSKASGNLLESARNSVHRSDSGFAEEFELLSTLLS